MIKWMAISVVVAASLAGASAPAVAQGGTVTARPCASGDPSCSPGLRGIPGASQRPREVPGDPGYYRPDPKPRPPSGRPPHRPPYGPPPGYYLPSPPPYYESGRISCNDARRIVRNEGFHRVRKLDCQGRQYQFRATYRGRPVIVVVSSRSGRILDVQRI